MDRQRVLIIPKDLVADKRISVTARLVLAQLLDHRNRKTGQCNPRRRVLGRELGVSMPTITRALRELRDVKLISYQQGLHTNFYKIHGDQFDHPMVIKMISHGDQNDQPDPLASLYEPFIIERGENGTRALRPVRAVRETEDTAQPPAPDTAAFPPQKKKSTRNTDVPRKLPRIDETLRAYYEEEARKAGQDVPHRKESTFAKTLRCYYEQEAARKAAQK